MTNQIDREAFEKWCQTQWQSKVDFTRGYWNDEHYVDEDVHTSWVAWKAATLNYEALVKENEQLKNCLNIANSSSEDFERKWYLQKDRNEQLREALLTLSNGDMRDIGVADKCKHSLYGYEACEDCYQEYAKQALAKDK